MYKSRLIDKSIKIDENHLSRDSLFQTNHPLSRITNRKNIFWKGNKIRSLTSLVNNVLNNTTDDNNMVELILRKTISRRTLVPYLAAKSLEYYSDTSENIPLSSYLAPMLLWKRYQEE